MSLDFVGWVKNRVEGFVASEFNARATQGVALFPGLAFEVLSRADLVGTAAMTAPLANATTATGVETNAVGAKIVGAVVDNSGAGKAVVHFFDAAPTLGTTEPVGAVVVPAGKSGVVLFPEPVAADRLYWEATTTFLPGGGYTRSAAGSVRVMLVYAKN